MIKICYKIKTIKIFDSGNTILDTRFEHNFLIHAFISFKLKIKYVMFCMFNIKI